uniref:butyrophilin-like protein 1 n=1 Tax=Semicossyphus pulcher TaxID=241346 RepID=UPI0037E7AD3A
MVTTLKEVKSEHDDMVTKLTEVKTEHDMVTTLTEVKTELEEQRDHIKGQLEKTEAERERNKENLQSVEKDITEREQNFDKPEELLRQKEELLQAQWKLDERKKVFEREILNKEKLLEPIEIQFTNKNRNKDFVVYMDQPEFTHCIQNMTYGFQSGFAAVMALSTWQSRLFHDVGAQNQNVSSLNAFYLTLGTLQSPESAGPAQARKSPQGRMQEISSPHQVMVMVGDDVVLPCQLDPPIDAVSMTVEWGRPDLNPRFVYVWHDGKELSVDQNEAYKQRASLSVSKLKRGDLSLTLTKVTISDNGIYRCYIPKQNKQYFVELLVGAVPSPGRSIAGIHKASSGVMLDCESEGWYPEPEVLWLDGEGNHLSAGRTETVRGPDDLYTVSSRLTVEERHSSSFTCRVQQKNINQTRETHLYVSDDFFVVPSGCTSSIAFSVLFAFMFTVAAVFSAWIWRKNRTGKQEINVTFDEGRSHLFKRKMYHNNKNEDREAAESRERLMTKNKEMEDLEKKKEKLKELKKKEKLREELQRKEEEQKDMTQVIETLKGLIQEQEKHKQLLTLQMKEAQRLGEEHDKKIKEVEKEVNEKEGDKTANKAQGYLRLKELFQEAMYKQEDKKKEHQQLQYNADKLIKKAMDDVNRITERKNRVEEHMERIKKQLEETEKRERRPEPTDPLT